MSKDKNNMVDRIQVWNEDIQPCIERGQAFPIIPEQQICIFAYTGNGPRFARIFTNVWNALPMKDRDTIYAHWRKGFHGNIFSPRIELTGGWAQRENGHLGATLELGHRLAFHAPSVDELSDAAVTELIAHELAHVFQEAMWPGSMLRDSNDPWIEVHADVIVDEWGFELNMIEEDLSKRN